MQENKYNAGEVVYAIAFPEVKLIIRRYLDRIYYCQLATDRSKPDLVYFERELMQSPSHDVIEAQDFGR